nr:hypothetical protein [Deltaproteobacteria bacterium]
MKTAATRRTLISITGLTLCALAVGCDQGRDDTPPCSAADCDAGPEPISTVFVDADLFAEVLDWSDPNSGALEAALAAGGTAEAMRSTDDACPGVGADPEIQAASCTSSRDQLVNLMMTQAAKDDGPQCLLVAGVDEKLRVDTHSTGEAKGFESNNGVTQRFSRQGPAGATLITASSKLQLEGEQEDGPDYLESRDAAERIRVMSLCYDDNGRVVADGPAATIRI